MGVEMMWRLACGLLLVGWTAAFIVTVRRGLRVLREVGVQADASWRMIVGVMGASSFGALVVGTLGVRSSALYLLALLLQLVMCAMYFYRFFVGIHNRAPATRS